MIRSFVTLSLALSAFVAAANAQSSLTTKAAVQNFRQANGEAWRLRVDAVRGVPEHIFGGRLATGAQTGDEASFGRAARDALFELEGVLGIDAEGLELVRVKSMNLARAGTSDKVTVQFRQSVAGVPVHFGTINVLLDARTGHVLSVDNQSLPLATGLDVAAEVSLDDASRLAVRRFNDELGLIAEAVEMTDYIVWGPKADRRKQGLPTVPAYVIRVSAPTGPLGTTPADVSYVIAARGGAELLDQWNNVHDLDLTGNVKGWAQPGLLPFNVDPETLQNLADVRLSASGEPDVFSDADGNFVFPGVNSTKTVTARLNGQFSDIDNNSGSDASIAQAVSPGSPASFIFNPSQAELTGAELDAHMSVIEMRDYLRGVDPSETTLDFQIPTNVNIGLSCNAFYNGISLNFYVEGEHPTVEDLFCRNTAYSTVVYHEEGHWMNDLYGSSNDQFGMGEGGADVWAMYAADDPVVGADFRFDGGIIRSGENSTPFCGDESLGCYGESHADGQPLMGAIWKIRRNLKISLGDSAGRAVADQLMLGWYQAFDDRLVRTIIEEHWLVLDDDNGDLSDGTPHYTEIDAAFVEQGFPSFQLPIFDISHAAITHVRHEGGVLVQADITEIAAAALTGAVLHYSFDGGDNFSSVAMTDLGGNSFEGSIPGVVSPARVAYYIEAQSASLGGATFPELGAARPIFYDVGELSVIAFNDFEGVTDEGWTHVQFATQDDWQRDEPQGKGLDPGAAFSGSLCWGNDLGLSGFNGEYQPDVSNALFSPSFDLSGVSGARLRFQRWLSVERQTDGDPENQFDTAFVKLDGAIIWESPETTHTTDAAWRLQDIDISALADGDSNVQISFELESDGGLNMGGWNVDDFAIVSLTEVIDTSFSSYGVATPGAGGAAVLSGSGQAVPSGPLSLDVTNAASSAFGVLFVGTDMISVPAFGGTFLVGNFFASLNIPTNGAGQVNLAFQLPAVIDPILDGQLVTTQYWYLDAGAPAGKAATQGLSFTLDV